MLYPVRVYSYAKCTLFYSKSMLYPLSDIEVLILNFTDPREQSLGDREVCARPDCTHNVIMDGVFFVSGIVGRRTKVEGGRGRQYIWLVKWDG